MTGRKKKCKTCGEKFQPFNTIQATCAKYECIMPYKALQEEKKRKRELREWKKKDNDTVSKWTKKVQELAFNPYIRARDKDDPCISCGKFDHEIKDYLRGGKWDAGHFISRGHEPALRFEPDNCHKQCKSCNGGSGKYSRKRRSTDDDFRNRLIEKIGIDRVEWLEGPHEQKRYRVDDLKELYAHYKALTKGIRND